MGAGGHPLAGWWHLGPANASWHLKRPKCIWSLRPPESPQVQLEQHSTSSEICSHDVYSKSSANYLESAISSESAHFLSHASVVLVQLALAFGYRSGSSSNSILN